MGRLILLVGIIVSFLTFGSCYREETFSIVFTSDTQGKLVPVG